MRKNLQVNKTFDTLKQRQASSYRYWKHVLNESLNGNININEILSSMGLCNIADKALINFEFINWSKLNDKDME